MAVAECEFEISASSRCWTYCQGFYERSAFVCCIGMNDGLLGMAYSRKDSVHSEVHVNHDSLDIKHGFESNVVGFKYQFGCA